MYDPWGTYMTHRGGDQGRARAREARLLLVRAPDAGVPGRELRPARPRAVDPDPVARDRRRRRVQPGRVDPARRRRHEPHRRHARRHHRRAQDRDRVRGLRPPLRDPHGRLGQPAGLGATSEDTSEYYEKGLLAPGVDYDAPHPYLTATPATRSTPTATSTCPPARAWATTSCGTTSTTTWSTRR